MDINVFVRGGNNGLYESMTKEEILAAITQAITGGTVGNVDTGFVTTIKEQNKGQGLMFWVGTTAEYEAMTERPNNVLYIKTDDTSAADINTAISSINTSITTIQGNLANFAPINHASNTSQYGAGSPTQYGHLMLTAESSSAGQHWADSTTYSGKAVSGADGADFDTRIKENASDISDLQAIAKVPTGTILISATEATAAAFAEWIGYGTWALRLSGTIGDRNAFYYERIE